MGEPENGRDVRSSVETRFLDVLNDKIKCNRQYLTWQSRSFKARLN